MKSIFGCCRAYRLLTSNIELFFRGVRATNKKGVHFSRVFQVFCNINLRDFPSFFWHQFSASVKLYTTLPDKDIFITAVHSM